MLKESDPRLKLVPLRRFANEELYDTTYLSVLVQRKKLKATKVGRVYWTSEAWFQEYLDKHAREEIREKYQIFFSEIGKTGINNSNKIINKLNKTTARKTGGFFVGLKRQWFRAASFGLGVFILIALIINILVTLDAGQGRISGVEEGNMEVATSSEIILIDE